ncbi:hypothetical protein VITU102760_25035 [Vibrio tubiashii]
MNKIKCVFITLIVATLTACSSSPPEPIQPEGERFPVNPAKVLVTDLES